MLTPPRSMPPKYFYDEVGSQLFDQICQVREYYPTRTERALLTEYGEDILRRANPSIIFELGSGTSSKTRELLALCPDLGLAPAYWPYDVSEEILTESAAALAKDFAWMDVHVLIGDYTGGLAHLPDPDQRTLALFLGGTIGNFPEPDAIQFLRDLRSHLNPGDHLLMGMDCIKPVEVIEAAYNDSEGLTARFNLNLLNVLNRELEADFNADRFRHRALFNEEQSRIEMYLESKADQSVHIGALATSISLGAEEPILTEISRKFSARSRRHLLASAGFAEVTVYEPDNNFFSLVLAEVDGDAD